jgi:hypothetical protein
MARQHDPPSQSVWGLLLPPGGPYESPNPDAGTPGGTGSGADDLPTHRIGGSRCDDACLAVGWTFALGASVSGVPIWNAATLQGDLMTAVEVSGAQSKSSVATVTDFLVEVLARG